MYYYFFVDLFFNDCIGKKGLLSGSSRTRKYESPYLTVSRAIKFQSFNGSGFVIIKRDSSEKKYTILFGSTDILTTLKNFR